jgi:hypothetical protein
LVQISFYLPSFSSKKIHDHYYIHGFATLKSPLSVGSKLEIRHDMPILRLWLRGAHTCFMESIHHFFLQIKTTN